MLHGPGGGGGGGGGNPQNPPPPPAPAVTNVTNVTQIRIDFRDKDRFNGNDYDIWSMRLQGIFEEHDLWDIVSGRSPKPAAGHADLPTWNKSDKRARNIILSALDKSMVHHTNAADTSSEVWKRLENLYRATDSTHKMSITKQFHSLTMRDGEQVEKYVQQF